MNYNDLPDEPKALYQTIGHLDKDDPPHSKNDKAQIAPTFGLEGECMVWVINIHSEQSSYKCLLTRTDLEQVKSSVARMLTFLDERGL